MVVIWCNQWDVLSVYWQGFVSSQMYGVLLGLVWSRLSHCDIVYVCLSLSSIHTVISRPVPLAHANSVMCVHIIVCCDMLSAYWGYIYASLCVCAQPVLHHTARRWPKWTWTPCDGFGQDKTTHTKCTTKKSTCKCCDTQPHTCTHLHQLTQLHRDAQRDGNKSTQRSS